MLQFISLTINDSECEIKQMLWCFSTPTNMWLQHVRLSKLSFVMQSLSEIALPGSNTKSQSRSLIRCVMGCSRQLFQASIVGHFLFVTAVVRNVTMDCNSSQLDSLNDWIGPLCLLSFDELVKNITLIFVPTKTVVFQLEIISQLSCILSSPNNGDGCCQMLFWLRKKVSQTWKTHRSDMWRNLLVSIRMCNKQTGYNHNLLCLFRQ